MGYYFKDVLGSERPVSLFTSVLPFSSFTKNSYLLISRSFSVLVAAYARYLIVEFLPLTILQTLSGTKDKT